MTNWQKKGVSGEASNVDSGSGSKGGSTSRDGAKGQGAGGRARGPSVQMTDGGSAVNSQKTSADATEKTRNADFAQGGDTAMFGEQEAGSRLGPDKSPSTGKPDSSGPGEKFAKGGTNKMFGFAGALPATAGISAARES